MSEVSPIVVIMGPPGSGKGTQGDLLEKSLGFKKVSTGDILRSHVKRQTELGKKVSSIIDAGNFVSNEILAELVQCELSELLGKSVLLDGYPRNMQQAKDFADSVSSSRLKKVVSLDVDPSLLIARVVGRMVCSSCGATYHQENHKPRVSGVCDKCSGALITRGDDSKEKIEKRLEVYRRETEPLLSYYSDLGLLESIDGNATPAQVSEEISNKLAEIDKKKLEIS